MKYLVLLSFIFVATTLYGNTIAIPSASFDCKKVSINGVEEHICKDTNLMSLDQQLNKIYKSFYRVTAEIKESQNSWLKIRDRCKTNACIQQAYKSRIQTLKNALNIQKQFSKDMIALIDLHSQRKQIKNSSCSNFYKDLFLFQNIHVVKPTLDRVDYNNTQLKKELGMCWNMGMDYSYQNFTKFSVWHSDMDGDGEKDLVFGQQNGNGSNAVIYVLDEVLCTDAMNNTSKFDPKKDKKYIYRYYMHGDENTILEYKGKGYQFEASAYAPRTLDVRRTELIMYRTGIENASNCTYTAK